MNQWFRLYSEILNDPKVQIVTEALRWRYVALLCLHCNGGYENTPNDEIALSLRVTEEEWLNTRQEFIKRKLLTVDGKINNWEKRQYISDLKDSTAAQRQKRYRERKRNNRNATVTSRLPDSDTDTEREKNNTKKDNPEFQEFWIIFPSQRKGNREKAAAAYRQALTRSSHETIMNGLKYYLDSNEVRDGFAKGATAWLNDDRWQNNYKIEAIGGKSYKHIVAQIQPVTRNKVVL